MPFPVRIFSKIDFKDSSAPSLLKRENKEIYVVFLVFNMADYNLFSISIWNLFSSTALVQSS